MALGIAAAQSGEFAARVQFNAKAGRFYRVDREQNGDGWNSTEVDITDSFAGVMDLDNIEVGWAHFAVGAVDVRMVKIGQPIPPQPSPDHKQGFRLRMMLASGCAGGKDRLRELTSTARMVVGAMDLLHTQFLSEKDKNAGKLPIVTSRAPLPVKNKHGTNYQPVWEITGWVDRPEALGGTGPAPVEAAPASPPPLAITRSEPVSADDFG